MFFKSSARQCRELQPRVLTMRVFNRLGFVVAGLAFLLTAPMSMAGNDAAKIRAATGAWFNAYNTGNADAMVQIYAVDAVSMPPWAPPARGQSAIRQFLNRDMADAKEAGVGLVQTGSDDVAVKGNMAWHSGTYAVKTKAGATIDAGGYLEVWRRSAGQWRIVRDIWNSSSPPSAPALAPRSRP